MNLHDLPLGYEDPLVAMLVFHRRIERQLATLGALPSRVEAHGVDSQASADAAAALEFFSGKLEVHHADEDALMPMLEMRIAGAPEHDEFQGLRHRLESEHREMERSWRGLRRPLEAIAEGLHRRVPLDLVQYFRGIHATHISLDEAGPHPKAPRPLLAGSRAALGRGMAARRTRKFRFQ